MSTKEIEAMGVDTNQSERTHKRMAFWRTGTAKQYNFSGPGSVHIFEVRGV